MILDLCTVEIGMEDIYDPGSVYRIDQLGGHG
jgi:hypothetical protein